MEGSGGQGEANGREGRWRSRRELAVEDWPAVEDGPAIEDWLAVDNGSAVMEGAGGQVWANGRGAGSV